MIPKIATMFRITGYEHVGIRVSDRDVSIRFYETLGFREDSAYGAKIRTRRMMLLSINILEYFFRR